MVSRGQTRGERGFHVFKMLERRSGGDYEFDEIRDRLRVFYSRLTSSVQIK